MKKAPKMAQICQFNQLIKCRKVSNRFIVKMYLKDGTLLERCRIWHDLIKDLKLVHLSHLKFC